MRSFVISVIVILICFTVTFVNCIWTDHTVDRLIRMADSVDTDPEAFINEWNNAKTVLAYTTRKSYIREVDAEIGRLRSSAESGDGQQLYTAKRSIIYKMKEICDSHSFKLKSIL